MPHCKRNFQLIATVSFSTSYLHRVCAELNHRNITGCAKHTITQWQVWTAKMSTLKHTCPNHRNTKKSPFVLRIFVAVSRYQPLKNVQLCVIYSAECFCCTNTYPHRENTTSWLNHVHSMSTAGNWVVNRPTLATQKQQVSREAQSSASSASMVDNLHVLLVCLTLREEEQ